jgi:hypothetical protein
METDTVEALTVTRRDDLELVTYWIHDAHFDCAQASSSETDSR